MRLPANSSEAEAGGGAFPSKPAISSRNERDHRLRHDVFGEEEAPRSNSCSSDKGGEGLPQYRVTRMSLVQEPKIELTLRIRARQAALP